MRKKCETNEIGLGKRKFLPPALFHLIFAAFLTFLPFFSGFFSPELLSAEPAACSVCGRRIKGGETYYTASGKIYCSKKCFETTFPKCTVCGKKSEKGFRNESGAFFCSRECLSSSWNKCAGCGKRAQSGLIVGGEDGKFFCPDCAQKPRCFACGMPFDCEKIEDGRLICPHCQESAVTDFNEFLEILNNTRKLMREKLQIQTEHEITFRLVDRPTLDKITPGSGSQDELGAFKFEKMTEKVVLHTGATLFSGPTKKTIEENVSISRKIFILSHLPKKKLIEVCAHELAHDWMQEFFPHINRLKTKEGWAEFVAWRINSIVGSEDLNRRIEQNLHPDYGDGFRMMKQIYTKSGFKGVLRFIEEENRKESPNK